MAAADYVVKTGDLPGPLEVDLSYSDGTAPDLTVSGTTVAFRMRAYGQASPLLAGTASILGAARVAYAWADGDFALPPGFYQVDFRVLGPGGVSRETFPADSQHPYILIQVLA